MKIYRFLKETVKEYGFGTIVYLVIGIPFLMYLAIWQSQSPSTFLTVVVTIGFLVAVIVTVIVVRKDLE